jgi:hypothetical protein
MIEHESEIEWTTPRTNTCPSTYYSRRRILKIYFYFEYQQAVQASDPMFSKYFNFCYLSHRFKCILSVVRVILSYACSFA